MTPRTVPVRVNPSARLLSVWAALGLAARRAEGDRPLPREAAAELLARLAPGRIALVTGASGAGKSTLLRTIGEHAAGAGAPVAWVREVPTGPRAVIDLFDGPPAEVLASLSRAGLAEAALFGRTPEELSAGERFRLALAMALHGAPAGATLLADEFAGVLDRTTARCVSLGVSRWAARTGCRVVCATAHDDVREWLTPDVLVWAELDGSLMLTGRGSTRRWGGDPCVPA